MGIGNRPIAWLVLGVFTLFLVGTIALQAVPPPVTPTAVPQAAAPAAAPTAAPAAAAGGGASTTINATEKDFAIAMDNSSVPAGSVTFKIKNDGPSPHTFHVKVGNDEMGTQAVPPGTTAMLMLNLWRR